MVPSISKIAKVYPYLARAMGWFFGVPAKFDYAEYLQSDVWKSKAAHARERDCNRCRLCNSPDNLQVHHRTYERIGHELLDDLTTLCDECHELYHKGYRKPEWY